MEIVKISKAFTASFVVNKKFQVSLGPLAVLFNTYNLQVSNFKKFDN